MALPAGEGNEADFVVAGWHVIDERTRFSSRRRLPSEWVGAHGAAPCLGGGANLFLDANPAAWNKLFRLLFACRTRRGSDAAFDALKNRVQELAFPSTDAGWVDLGEFRDVFDIVLSGGDLADVFRARCDWLSARNEKERCLDERRDAQLSALKRRVVERDKRLADRERMIAARDSSLKKARAAVRRRENEIRVLQAFLSYRAGAALERFHKMCRRFQGRDAPTARPTLRTFRGNVPTLQRTQNS